MHLWKGDVCARWFVFFAKQRYGFGRLTLPTIRFEEPVLFAIGHPDVRRLGFGGVFDGLVVYRLAQWHLFVFALDHDQHTSVASAIGRTVVLIQQLDVRSDVRPARVADPVVLPFKPEIVLAPRLFVHQPVQYALTDALFGRCRHLIAPDQAFDLVPSLCLRFGHLDIGQKVARARHSSRPH